MKYFILGFKKWNDVNGRSNLREFWYFYLFYILFSILFSIIDTFISSDFEIISGMFGLICLVPFTTLTTRRLHDIDKSGYNLLWIFTIIGILFILIMNMFKGTEGDNKYGPPSTL